MDQKYKEQFLTYIIDASKPNATPTNPNGYCYLEQSYAAAATELHNEELVQALVAQTNDKGEFPVRPTDLGVKWVAALATGANKALTSTQAASAAAANPRREQQQPVQTQAMQGIQVEQGIPIPDKKPFGRVSGGDDKVTKYGFDKMPVNASFFVPQDDKHDKDGEIIPIHRSFSSVVSQANKKLHPKNFIVREFTQPEGQPYAGQTGARVWRVEDMQGERPHRTRKVNKKAEPAAHVPQAVAGFQGQPFGGGQPFGAAPQPGTFAAPAPGQAFPGGFPAPGAPAFGGGPAPAFGGAPTFDAPMTWGDQGGFGSGPLPPEAE